MDVKVGWKKGQRQSTFLPSDSVAKPGICDFFPGLPDTLLHRSYHGRKLVGMCRHWTGVQVIFETSSAKC